MCLFRPSICCLHADNHKWQPTQQVHASKMVCLNALLTSSKQATVPGSNTRQSWDAQACTQKETKTIFQLLAIITGSFIALFNHPSDSDSSQFTFFRHIALFFTHIKVCQVPLPWPTYVLLHRWSQAEVHQGMDAIVDWMHNEGDSCNTAGYSSPNYRRRIAWCRHACTVLGKTDAQRKR